MSRTAKSGSNSSALERVSSSRPRVIGHRGYSSAAPENTLPSFGLGLDAGADMIELDYQQSLDGVPVVIHDDNFDRTTNSRKIWRRRRVKVSSKTAEEIRALDAGSWFGAQFGGARIPLLTEAVEFILARGGVPLVERKSGDAASAAKLFRERGWIDRVMLISFDWPFLRAVHQLEPEQRLGALGPTLRLADGRRVSRWSGNFGRRWLDELEMTGAGVAVWNSRVTGDSVGLAHSRGLKVWVYTVDTPSLAARLSGIGVDGIITNRIDRIRKAVAPARRRACESADREVHKWQFELPPRPKFPLACPRLQ